MMPKEIHTPPPTLEEMKASVTLSVSDCVKWGNLGNVDEMEESHLCDLIDVFFE